MIPKPGAGADTTISAFSRQGSTRWGQDVDAGISVSSSPLDPVWDAFVDAAPGGHHLQTTLWAQVKAKYGWQVIRLRLQRDGELVGGCQLLVRSLGPGTIAYCPRGPLFRDGDPSALNDLLDAVAKLAHRKQMLYVKVQPSAAGSAIEPLLRQRGFVISDMPAAPVATVRVNLVRPSDEILAGMRSTTRANIGKAGRKGIVVRPAGAAGLPVFGKLLAETSQRQRFSPYPVDYYAEILRQFGAGHRAELLLAERDGEALAGAIIIGYGDTVVYKMGAWAGQRPGLHPNELMHWHAIQWARDRGYRYYDLEGIHESVARARLAGAEMPTSGRRGTTHFKLGMGGEVTLYPHAYDRSFHPLLVWPARMLTPRLTRFKPWADRFLGRVRSRE